MSLDRLNEQLNRHINSPTLSHIRPCIIVERDGFEYCDLPKVRPDDSVTVAFIERFPPDFIAEILFQMGGLKELHKLQNALNHKVRDQKAFLREVNAAQSAIAQLIRKRIQMLFQSRLPEFGLKH